MANCDQDEKLVIGENVKEIELRLHPARFILIRDKDANKENEVWILKIGKKSTLSLS